MNPWALIGLLALIAACSAAAFYAGYRAASAYLPAARAVSDVTAAAVEQVNTSVALLDKTGAALSSLESAIAKQTETIAERNSAVEDALLALFQGLERAGLVRPGTVRGVAKQVGEGAPPE
jgi:hypothetical protein